jgi:transcriptional regulator with XRE-family HTH domain
MASGDREFGAQVRDLRKQRGLTQEGLAERSALSVDAVRGVEHGAFSPTLGTVRKLAGGLDVSLTTLFNRFQRKRHTLVDEICDYLSGKTRREMAQAWRVIRAMFKEPGESALP